VRNHPCRSWCPSEFLARRCVVRDRSSARFEQFFLSNSVPRLVSLSYANADNQISVSVSWPPWIVRKPGNCWFVTARKRRSSSGGSGNCFLLANAGDMPLPKPSMLEPDLAKGSFHDLLTRVAVPAGVFLSISIQLAKRLTARGQSHSRVVTQRLAPKHPVRRRNPVSRDLRTVSVASAISRARVTNIFGSLLATLDGNWKGGDLQDLKTILTPSRRSIRKPTRPTSRPWSAAEIHVRGQAERALERAKACAAAASQELAINYCLGGLRVTWGFTRPFAIRDQITDFMLQVDPQGRIRRALEIAFLDGTRTSAE
jgi:hypothetical protein